MASPTHAGKPPLRLVWRKSDPPPDVVADMEWRPTAHAALSAWRGFPPGVRRHFQDDLITFLHAIGVFVYPPECNAPAAAPNPARR